jgi:hypothetical protein
MQLPWVLVELALVVMLARLALSLLSIDRKNYEKRFDFT